MVHINLGSKYPQQYHQLRPLSHIRLNNLLLIVLLSESKGLRFNQLNIYLQIFIQHFLESSLSQCWWLVHSVCIVVLVGSLKTTFEHFFVGACDLLYVV